MNDLLRLREWFKTYAITAAERRQLADAAGMPTTLLYMYAGGHRRVTPQAAARLERASLELSRVRAGTVPVLSRGALCTLCAECPHHPPVARDVP